MLVNEYTVLRMGNHSQASKFSKLLGVRCLRGAQYSVPTKVVIENSHDKRIECKCDKCGVEFVLMSKDIKHRKDGYDLCKSCALSKHIIELNMKFGNSMRKKALQTRKKNPNFNKICKNNLPPPGSQCGENNPNWIERNEEYFGRVGKYKVYSRDVARFTRKQPIHTLKNIEKRGMLYEDGAYHLDHKISKKFGYLNNISPILIGDIENLEFIPAKQNCVKRANCSMTFGELLARIEMRENDGIT